MSSTARRTVCGAHSADVMWGGCRLTLFCGHRLGLTKTLIVHLESATPPGTQDRFAVPVGMWTISARICVFIFEAWAEECWPLQLQTHTELCVQRGNTSAGKYQRDVDQREAKGKGKKTTKRQEYIWFKNGLKNARLYFSVQNWSIMAVDVLLKRHKCHSIIGAFLFYYFLNFYYQYHL